MLTRPKIEFRQYQKEAIWSLWDYFGQKSGNPIIAIPCGCGKSLIPAGFIQQAMETWPNQRFLIVTHVKEIIAQNANKMLDIWPSAPVGVYSAGLNKRDSALPIIYGGIASMYEKAFLFGHRDVMFLDECFDGETEILTENGFIRFDKLNAERVAAVASNFAVKFEHPSAKIVKYPSSPMRRVESPNTFDIHATARHNMIVNDRAGTWRYCALDDVVRAPYVKMAVAAFGAGDDEWLTPSQKLAICFQADGSLHNANVDGTSILSFSFSKQRKINAFLALMEEGDFSYKLLDQRAAKGNVKTRYRFMVYMDRTYPKDISTEFKLANLSWRKAQSIIEYMNIWGGHIASDNTYLYTNTNKGSVDFYQAVATLAGYKTTLSEVIDDRSETFSNVFRLFITKRQTVSTQSWKVSSSDYTGLVYCVSVSTGAIIIRRGGKTLIAGNCHLLSPDAETMYRTFIADLKKINPYLKIIGLTATPFRLGQGYITDTIVDKQGNTIKPIFTDIAYNLTTMEAFARLIAEGYLMPVIAQRTRTELDVSSVGMNRGEFAASALQDAVDRDDITSAALKEAVNAGYDRGTWFVPCSGVGHSEHVAATLNTYGISAAAVHSKIKQDERDQRIKAYKSGQLRALAVYNVGIIGFDHPPIDYMPILRPTMSPPLWVQLIGRGMRPSPGKTNLLVSDFAANTRRLGPINDPVIPRKKGEGTGDVPVRICETCGCYNHARARICVQCGQEFTFEEKLVSKPFTDDLLRSDLPIVEYFNVDRVVYSSHNKIGSPPTVKVSYFCGLHLFYEWVCFEHTGFAGKKARDWWRMRYNSEPPPTTDDALRFVRYLRWPRRLRVWTNKKFPEILSCEF